MKKEHKLGKLVYWFKDENKKRGIIINKKWHKYNHLYFVFWFHKKEITAHRYKHLKAVK